MTIECISRVVRHGELLRAPTLSLVFVVKDGYVLISKTGEVSTPNKADVYVNCSYLVA